VLKESNCFWK